MRLNEDLTDPNSDIQYPPSRFSDVGSLEENSNNNGMEEKAAAKGVSDQNRVANVRVEKAKSKLLGESVLMDKLEKWADQYKKDVENWGLGSYPIFTVYQDFSGNVKHVSVDEGEILRRSQVQPEEIEDFPEVNYKILSAKRLAREMENGNNVIPKNSSVAKFVVQGKETGFVNTIKGFASQPDLLPKLSGVGSRVLWVFVFMWAVKELFTFKNKETQYTEMEKEMMRRKIKSRKDKEMLKGTVDVISEASEPPMLHVEMPKLDKEKLKNNIMKAKASADEVLVGNSSFKATATSTDMTTKVQEIRDMARQARQIEGKIHSLGGRGREMDDFIIGETSVEGVHKLSEEGTSSSKHQNDVVRKTVDIDGTLRTPCMDVMENIYNSLPHKVVLEDGCKLEASNVMDSNDKKCNKQETEFSQSTVQPKDEEVSQLPDTTVDDSCMTKESFTNNKPLVIRSVKEARAYLSKKHDKQDVGSESRVQIMRDNMDDLRSATDIDSRSQESQLLEMNTAVARNSALVGISDLKPAVNAGEDSNQKDKESGILKNDHIKDSEVKHEVGDPQNSETSLDHEVNGVNTETNLSEKTENWLEENFDEVETIIKKIRAGFRDNYVAAKERVDQPLDITEMEPLEDDGEFDWMQNEHLRDIVFKVRDNELAGRDPFYLIDDKDKEAFFRGLEKKVDKENRQLSYLHEWLHSNIENLDYGADGISLYDPPEKIIPRWKGPPVEKIPDFLNDFLEQRKKNSTSKMEPVKNEENGFTKKSVAASSDENVKDCVATRDSMKIYAKNKKNPKTVVEGSDGSVKAGKKSGKEYWQHTKKWSQGFLESYNAEADPEVKSVMKDIGKDLDRWITEKEIEEAAELMNRIPDKNRSILDKKLNKVKREMELFGPQAVVSKYREYADEREEDYLWWLDLPYVLCIELYTIDDGEQRVGFYSLEMAKDLEVEPRPHHVIAFQDAGDCKSLCYIIQAHMDMLGNGQAFVVAQSPKDAFREAKANGFGVTVIKKGELKLNIDEPLEEVEEEITEIGSKMYHDMIMKEQSVDINSLMKGVFGFSDRSIKRLKRKTKKPRK